MAWEHWFSPFVNPLHVVFIPQILILNTSHVLFFHMISFIIAIQSFSRGDSQTPRGQGKCLRGQPGFKPCFTRFPSSCFLLYEGVSFWNLLSKLDQAPQSQYPWSNPFFFHLSLCNHFNYFIVFMALFQKTSRVYNVSGSLLWQYPETHVAIVTCRKHPYYKEDVFIIVFMPNVCLQNLFVLLCGVIVILFIQTRNNDDAVSKTYVHPLVIFMKET